jgi:DNA-binding response OmpR family regulator
MTQDNIMNANLLKGIKILVVEDDPDLLGILSEFLAMQGAEVFQSLNGKEALDRLHRTPVDLVLSDVQMPVMDGVELLKAIKKNDHVSPKVFLTSGHSHLDESAALGLGAAAFITKPFKLQSLLSNICQELAIVR